MKAETKRVVLTGTLEQCGSYNEPKFHVDDDSVDSTLHDFNNMKVRIIVELIGEEEGA